MKISNNLSMTVKVGMIRDFAKKAPTPETISVMLNLMEELAICGDAWWLNPEIVKSSRNIAFTRIVQALICEDSDYIMRYNPKSFHRGVHANPFFQIYRWILSILRVYKYRFARLIRHRTLFKRDILFAYTQLGIGGAEKALVDIANMLTASGRSVDILLSSNDHSLSIIHSLNKDIDLVDYDIAVSRKYGYFVNYAHWISPRFLMGIIKSDKNIQYIHNDLASIFDFFPRDGFKREYKKMDTFVCVSQWVKSSFDSIYPDLRNKSVVIYNYYDAMPLLEEGLVPKRSRFQPGITRKIITVSRLHPAKGIRRIIRVAEILARESQDFVWNIYGDGPQKMEIINEIREKKLEGKVNLCGSRYMPFMEIAESDFMVIPSYYEGYGLVALEARALGVPIVASDYGPARESIRDGIDGIIVNNSIEGILKGVRLLLSRDAADLKLSCSRESAFRFINEQNEKARAAIMRLFSMETEV